MSYIHLTFGEVVRSGPTKWFNSGPAVPCIDSLGRVRLLLVDRKYWGLSRPRAREYKPRSWFGRKRRIRRQGVQPCQSTTLKISA